MSARGHHAAVRLTRAVLALLVIGIVVGITPAAYADPPDPLWIGGFWDDDDFDNTVVIIANACAIHALAPAHVGPVLVPGASLTLGDPVQPPSLLRRTLCCRAPPLTSSPHR